MRPRTTFIHQRGSNRTIIGPLINLLLDLLIRVHTIFLQSIDINSKRLMLANFQFLLLVLGEQVLHGFVINFQHANLDLEGASSILIVVDLLEDRVANDRDESLVGSVADHRVRFS